VKHYVLDSNAVTRYIRDNEGAEKVHAILQESERGTATLHMSVVNAGEAYYVLIRHMGEAAAAQAIERLNRAVDYAPVELEQAIKAGSLKERYKLGYADSFAAALAIELDATLVSADPDFEKLGRSLKRMKLPRHSGQ
jgi:ribonuclease VapC